MPRWWGKDPPVNSGLGGVSQGGSGSLPFRGPGYGSSRHLRARLRRGVARAGRAGAAASLTALMATSLAAEPAAAGNGFALGRPAGPAAAGGLALARGAVAQPSASVAITSVTPRIAQPGATVMVSGIVVNPTGAPVTGLSLQLWSSSSPLPSRYFLDSYISGTSGVQLDTPVGAVHPLTSPVAPYSSQRWTLSLQVSQLGMRAFGAYPLAAQLNGTRGAMAVARTLLPFWPGKAESRALRPVSIAWVWPLVDVPQEAVCRSLPSGQLAASVARGGRLNSLLAVGVSAAGRLARLTWAIDPALLKDVSLMTTRYRVGATSTCGGGQRRPASAAARSWLARVRAAARQQGFFITPYADVDVAALAHRGLDPELRGAFGAGRSVAHDILGATQSKVPPQAGIIAWPPDGVGDLSALQGLAANKVRTVILDSTMMPPKGQPTYTPSAVASTPVLGFRLHVLLADHTLTRILASPRAAIPGAEPAPPPVGGAGVTEAAAFAKEQWFLAETAMIAAEDPSLARSVVVAPPRRWDPLPGVASALLQETVTAPWLRPVSLSSLVTSRSRSGSVNRSQPPGRQVSAAELRTRLLTEVRRLTDQIHLLGSILVDPGRGFLGTAVAAIESSAWRGNRASQQHARRILRGVSAYVAAQLRQIKIVSLHVTLGGKSGSVPVSVSNHLNRAVRVKLEVILPRHSQVTIERFQPVVTVAGGTQRTIKIPVLAAAAGSTALTLRLATPDGTLLPQSATLTVTATHFGTLALVIIVVALVVFVLTAVGRAFRRGGGPAGGGDGEEKEEGNTPVTEPEPASDGPEADSVVTRGADDGHAVREGDDHASTPGQAQRL